MKCKVVYHRHRNGKKPEIWKTNRSEVVYKQKRRGPRTEPSGTPASKGEDAEARGPMDTYCERF